MFNVEEKIESVRLKRGLSVRAFAHMLGMSDTGYKKMIKEKTTRISHLQTCVEKFELPITYFFSIQTKDCSQQVEKLTLENDELRKDKKILQRVLETHLGKKGAGDLPAWVLHYPVASLVPGV